MAASPVVGTEKRVGRASTRPSRPSGVAAGLHEYCDVEVCVRVRTIGILLPLLVAVVATPAGAQTNDRNELTVFGGVSLANLRDVSTDPARILLAPRPASPILPSIERTATLGGSADFGARYGRRLSDTLTVEGDFAVAPGHDLEERFASGCPPDALCIAGPGVRLFVPDVLRVDRLVAYHYGGGVRLALLDGAVRPSVTGGLGGVTFTGSRLTDTRLAFRLGAGVETEVDSLTARLEVVDVIVADHFVTGRTEHDVHVRIGIGVRW